MQFSPQRRTRIIHAQLLHHQGKSLRQIAEQFGVSHSTVYDDLRCFDTHYAEIAQSLAHAMAVNHAISINAFLEQLISDGPIGPFAHIFSPGPTGEPMPLTQSIAIADVPGLHKQFISAAVALFRERRLAFRDLQHIAAQQPQQPQPSQPPAEQLTDTTADALPDPAELADQSDYSGQNLTPPTTSYHPNPPQNQPPPPNPPPTQEATAAPTPPPTQEATAAPTPPPTQGATAGLNPPPTQREVPRSGGGGRPPPTTPQNRAQRRQAQREAERLERQERKRRQPVA